MKIKHLLFLPLLLTSCNSINTIKVSYKNESSYTVGDLTTSENVNEIKVNYILGNINFTYSDDSNVYVTEKTDKAVSEDIQMRYYLTEGVLNIQPCATGNRDYTNAKRDLDIKIPTSYTLSSILVDSISSNINVEVDASVYTFNTVSGSIKMNINSFDKIECNVVSTNSEITVKEDIGVKVEFNSIGGKLTNNISKVDENHYIEYNTVSGNLKVNKA